VKRLFVTRAINAKTTPRHFRIRKGKEIVEFFRALWYFEMLKDESSPVSSHLVLNIVYSILLYSVLLLSHTLEGDRHSIQLRILFRCKQVFLWIFSSLSQQNKCQMQSQSALLSMFTKFSDDRCSITIVIYSVRQWREG
jgi:hypothetical protein